MKNKTFKVTLSTILLLSTVLLFSIPSQAASWMQDKTGWWYQKDDATYPKDQWETINERQYHFDSNGYMQTGWIIVDGNWYFLDTSGAMVSNQWVGNYYLNHDGVMLKNAQTPDGHYVDASGKWIQPGWKKNNIGWWYQYSDGTFPNNTWANINNKMYHFNTSGYMQTGWIIVDGNWYFLDTSGAMVSSQWVGNYYLDNNGVMLKNTQTPDGHYVDSNGKWIQPGWKKNNIGWWYQYPNGTFPSNTWLNLSNRWYYFNTNGYMQTGWVLVDGKWYFLDASGAMVSNRWIGNYYLGSDGAMLTNTWTPDGYYVGHDGAVVDSAKMWREKMLFLINKERSKNGVPTLELLDIVNYTSTVKAIDMYEIGKLDHYSPNLGYFYNQFEEVGLSYLSGGENIAYGYPTVESVMNGWMNSPGHKANILTDAYTHVGLGFYNGYWVQQFVQVPNY